MLGGEIMGRYARITQPGLIYHVIKRGNNREVIFAEEEDYQHYLNTLQRYKKKYGFKLFAYCLMTNHVHLLIKIGQEGTISRIVQSITIAHTRYYNYVYRRCGHVWQGRFHSPIVSEDECFLNVMKYIEQNPLRAGMVKNIEDYRWSSYWLNTRKKKSVLIDRDENLVFQGLGGNDQERIKAYKNLAAVTFDEDELKEIHISTRKGNNYLSEKFREQINALLPNKRRRGRPRKSCNDNFLN
jgi:putative transposase